jgi:Ni/Co efflux regulator RcnB
MLILLPFASQNVHLKMVQSQKEKKKITRKRKKNRKIRKIKRQRKNERKRKKKRKRVSSSLESRISSGHVCCNCEPWEQTY